MASPPICDTARTAATQPLLALPISPLSRAKRLTVLARKSKKQGAALTRTKAGRRRFRLLAPGGVTCAAPKLARPHTSAGKGRGHRQSQDRTASIITKAMITAPPDTPEPAAIRPARGQDHSHPSDHSGPASGSKRLTRDTSWWGRRQLQLRGGLAGALGVAATGPAPLVLGLALVLLPTIPWGLAVAHGLASRAGSASE